MKVLIVEDDLSVALEIEMMLEQIGITQVHNVKSWKHIYADLKTIRPDFAIIDIFLNKKENGLDLASKLRESYIPFIICTGYPHDEYSKKAQDLKAFAFFSKPIDKPAFKFTLQRLIQKLNLQNASANNLVVKTNKKITKIPMTDIAYIKTEGNYSSIIAKDETKYIQKQSLKKYLSLLNSNFLQIHRSMIVNADYIKSIDVENSSVLLTSEKSLPFGSKFKRQLINSFVRLGA